MLLRSMSHPPEHLTAPKQDTVPKWNISGNNLPQTFTPPNQKIQERPDKEFQ
ncbi:hypothetical protein [Acidocella aquatica]|uniref:hypothetical protein n=1 Tax=Acidocella aquatica TaxID=1922313 RepID=UPI0024E12353|nr:hypothetical protein [Acidocella aquatica]